MNIDEFGNLSKEEMFSHAAKIASQSGVAFTPDVIDGLWRVESGRGVNMFNPKSGAEGHTQIMPKTRATMEGRIGRAIDPYKLGDALYTTALLLKENGQRFKNVPDALRAYNGGWDPKTWGNTETAGYAGAILGENDLGVRNASNVSTAGAVASGSATRYLTAQEAYEGVPAGRQPKASTFPKTQAAIAAAALIQPGAEPDRTDSQRRATLQGMEGAGKAVEQEKANQGFVGTLQAAANTSLVVNGLKWATREKFEADPSFRVTEDSLRGYGNDEVNQLLDAKSQAEFDRIKFDVDDKREQMRLTNLHGEWWGFGASMLADLPGAVLTGGTATMGMKATGFGALRLAAQGQKTAALVSLGVEGAVGNLAATALLDASGYHQGSADYALGAIAGAVFNPALGGLAIGRRATVAAEQIEAQRATIEIIQKQAKLAERAQLNLGADATPDQLRAEIGRLDAEDVAKSTQMHQGSIPADRKIVADGLLDENGVPITTATEAEVKAAPVNGDPVANDMEVQNLRAEMGEQVAPRWEDPDFKARREQAFAMREDWQAKASKIVSNEVAPQDIPNLPAGVTVTKAAEAEVSLRPVRKLMDDVTAVYLPGDKVVLGTGVNTPGAGGEVMTVGNVHLIGIKPGSMPTEALHVATHELGHAIYHKWAPTAPVELMTRINTEWKDFAARARAGDKSAWERRWSATSPTARADAAPKPTTYTLSRDEYMAEQFVKHIQNKALAGDLGGKMSPGVIKQITQAVEAVLSYVRSLLDKGYIKSDKAADEFFTSILNGGFERKMAGEAFLAPELRLPTVGEAVVASVDTPAALAKEVKDFIDNPIARKYGLDLMPMATPAQRAEAKVVLAVYTKADNPAAAWNNIDPKRLNKLLAKAPDSWGLNPTSNAMLKSDNPVARMLATELLENGGGAGGRRSTAAIAKYMNERKIVGNSINEVQMQYKAYRQANGGSVTADFTNGTLWRKFNRDIAVELEARRSGNAVESPDAVKAAANTIEAAYERGRVMQIESKTPGWGALPDTSKGYMPHRMSTETVRGLSLAQKRAVQEALTDQFITISGYDPSFADQLSAKYLDLVSRRALGGFEASVGIHQPGAADVVKEALEQMNLSRPEIDAMMKRYTAGGAGHTKKRLDMDLTQVYNNEDGSQFQLLDLFETDQFKLLRSQSQRVSGEVALARHGIMGRPGLALMRRALEFGDNATKVKAKEMSAFDQIAAEFMGQPFGTQNKYVDRALQANSVMSLGGMGFNQLGEMINMAMTLGVKSTMQNVKGMPRLWKEVHALSKGKGVENGWLDSLETFGGAQFGTDNHKMVFPFDVPDHPYQTMGNDSVTALDRALRGGVHLQGTLSGWRSLHAVQTRGAAEQIVQKALRYINDGTESVALESMGITKELQGKLKSEMHRITRWSDGKMTGLDITKMQDLDAANSFVQAVHRGANQIIQGTFIGESGKYVHSSWGRLMTQFRSFSLTAIDKQWARQVGNYGVVKALMMTMAAMSVAAPIHMARVALAAQGRKDKEEYLEKQLHPTQIGRATLNYIATSGLAGDFTDALTAVTGVGKVTGGRSGAQSDFVGNVVAPALGKVDKVWGGTQKLFQEGDVHGLLKEAPLGRLPWLIPAINTLGN